MAAVKALNYKPDLIARSMSVKQSMQLAIFLENISNPFYGDIVQGFESSANLKGYSVIVCTSVQRNQECIREAVSRRLDGVFIMMMPFHYEQEALDILTNHGIRVVTSGFFNADLKKVSSIENDHITAMRELMLHLYERGHREIAFITGLSRKFKFDNRVSGYLRMVEELGLPCGDDLLIDGRPPYDTAMQSGYDLTRKLLKSGRRFTAMICVNDLTAFGAYTALQEHGLRIPEDVVVAGFDDILFSQFCNPPLTTMSVDKFAFGKKAFEMLYSNMKQGTTSFYLNHLELVQRRSTDFYR